jgi:hypothetical protein
MWTARILIGVIIAGIGFLLWFLAGLFREQPLRLPRVRLQFARQASGIRHLRLWNRWSAVRHEENVMTVHSVWWYGASRAGTVKGEPSCGTSSSYS